MPNSVHFQILTAAKTKLESLNLTGIADDSIRIRKLPLADDFADVLAERKKYEYPAILLSPVGIDTPKPATNLSDDVEYPVVLSLFTKNGDNRADLESDLDAYLLWREQIRKGFNAQRLTGVSSVWNCRVDGAAIVSPEHFAQGIWASFLILKFVSRERWGN